MINFMLLNILYGTSAFGLFLSLILLLAFLGKRAKVKKINENYYQLQHKLQELKIFNQKILDNVPVSIAIGDANGNVILTNSFFRKIVPWFDAQKGLNLLHSERLRQAGLADKYANVLKSGITFSQKGVLVKAPKPHYSFYINFDVIPLKNDEGAVIGVISIGQEITSLMKAKDHLTKINQKLDLEVKRRTEEFYQMNSQLSEKIEFYEKVFDFISSQIRETIDQVQELNYSSIVNDPEKQRHDKFSRVFNDFIVLNKIEKGQLDLNLERVDLLDLLKQVLPSEKITVINNNDKSLEVLADGSKIRQVLRGIYHRFQETSEQLRVTIEQRGQQIIITLLAQDKANQEFSGAQNNFFWDIQLFMYKEIIHLHKGVMQESINNQQVTFTIKLLTAF